MKLLLDTHAFIWSFHAPEMLSVRARELMEDRENSLYLSIVSVLEMQIKIQLGKLRFAIGLPELIETQQLKNDIQILALEPGHVYKLTELPALHKDPFDRLLVSQALSTGAALLSADPIVAHYAATVLW